MAAPEHIDAMASYEASNNVLVGRRVLDVTYWDIHLYGAHRTWDYGDWHHAVMGVELSTDAGPVTVTWTNTFFPYGVEVFDAPISEHLLLDPGGSEGWRVGSHEQWHKRANSPILRVSTFWEHITIGPGFRQGDGKQVSEFKEKEVPVGLRLDFAEGPVWFVAGIPDVPTAREVFVMGDEVMVVFTADRMRGIGFPREDFLRPISPPSDEP